MKKRLIQNILVFLCVQIYSISCFATNLGLPPKSSESYINIHCASIQPPLAIQASISINLNKIQKENNITTGDDKADIQYWITLFHKQTISFKQVGIKTQDNLTVYRGDDNGYFYALLVGNSSILNSIGNDKFFTGRILIGKLDKFGNPVGPKDTRGSDAICYFNIAKNSYS